LTRARALGLGQAIVALFVDNAALTLIGGAAVGYVTNWIALLWIFNPIEPTRCVWRRVVGGVSLRGLCGSGGEHICARALRWWFCVRASSPSLRRRELGRGCCLVALRGFTGSFSFVRRRPRARPLWAAGRREI